MAGFDIFTDGSGGGGGSAPTLILTDAAVSDYDAIDLTATLLALADGAQFQIMNPTPYEALITVDIGSLVTFTSVNPNDTCQSLPIRAVGGQYFGFIDKTTNPGVTFVRITGTNIPMRADKAEALTATFDAGNSASIVMQGSRAKVTFAQGAGAAPTAGSFFTVAVQSNLLILDGAFNPNVPVHLLLTDTEASIPDNFVSFSMNKSNVQATGTIVFGIYVHAVGFDSPGWATCGFEITIG